MATQFHLSHSGYLLLISATHFVIAAGFGQPLQFFAQFF
jgi:hypothetical protein